MTTEVQGFMSNQPTEVNFPITLLEDTVRIQASVRLSVLEALAFKQSCEQLITLNSIPKKSLLTLATLLLWIVVA